MVKAKYYDSSRVISRQRNLNFIIGPRGYGKTYGFKKYVISKAINGEGKFIYMRRKQTEIDEVIDFMGDLANDPKFKKYVFTRKGKELFYAQEKDEDDKWLWIHIGSLIALSVESKIKSREFSFYKYLIFDEWLPLSTGEFLKNETIKFASAIDTIFRRRDLQIFCVANSSIMYNPYFEYFKFYPSIDKEFTMDKKKSILIQNISDEEWSITREESPAGSLFVGTDYADYANDNKFLDDDDSLVEVKPASANNIMVFTLDSYIVGVWFDVETQTVYFSEQYNSTIVNKYSFDYDDLNEEYQTYKNLFGTDLLGVLETARKEGKIRFTSKKAKAHSRTITSRIYLF